MTTTKKWTVLRFKNGLVIICFLGFPTAIVMDNASYHSKRLEKVPNTSTKKAEMKEWLQRHDIVFEDDMTKAELLEVVR